MIDEAIILAGGLGTRMGNSNLPKWLTSIRGHVTIADYQRKWLVNQGVERLVITMSMGFLQFRDEIYGNPITYKPTGTFTAKALPEVKVVWEDEPCGDEGGLKKALDYLEGDEAIVINCDILTDLNLTLLPPAPALVVVHPRSPWGIFKENGFVEKPLLTSLWVNAGIYKFTRSIKNELVDRGEIARNIVPKLVSEGRMRVLKYEGKWLAVETPKDIESAKETV